MAESSEKLFFKLVKSVKAAGRSADSLDRAIQTLLDSLSTTEKIDQMAGKATIFDKLIMLIRYNLITYDAGQNKRLGIPPFRFTDGPRGVALGRSTCFPVSAARAAAWDPDLEERVTEAIAIEARARGADLFGGICVNVTRHPAWGRAQETYGEDPHLLGEMGAAAVRGAGRHVLTCVKHFACNSIEDSRFYVDVQIEERALREVYLPHFRKCLEAGADAVMSAYNRVNGEYCGHNRHLLTTVLKEDWGFSGFVVSDFVWGLYDTRSGIDAGLDLEMPHRKYYGKKLAGLVRQNVVSVRAIDAAVSRILRRKLVQAAKTPAARYTRNRITCAEHIRLAYETACRSIVLLKNNNNRLPLKKQAIRTIAVLGQLANRTNLGDHGSSRVRPPYTITPLDGIQNRSADHTAVVYDTGQDPRKAAGLAASADVTVIVAGLTEKDEGEYIPPFTGCDRRDLGLPEKQKELIRAVGEKAENCVVVLIGGSTITMKSWKHLAEAIVMAWYPGMEGGNAIADVLFGDVNPSGRLPVTFCESTDQLPAFDRKAASVRYDAYHGYRYLDRENRRPAFYFGFGLSYTTFSYANLQLDNKCLKIDETAVAMVDIKNTGGRAGEETVQLYIGCRGNIPRPVKELKAFKKVNLQPGQTKSVRLEVPVSDLAFYNEKLQTWEIERGQYTVRIGPSADPQQLQLCETFTVT